MFNQYLCLQIRLRLELMPFGQAPVGRVMPLSWGDEGLKAEARDPALLDSPTKFYFIILCFFNRN